MPRNRESRKSRLRAYLMERGSTRIGAAEWRDLLELLTPVSESYLQQLLRDLSVPVDQPFAGVRQHTFEELEDSLIELQRIYAAGGPQALSIRRMVIRAKDRARAISRSTKVAAEKRAQKEEMVRWLLVWLDDPAMFPVWVRVRKEFHCGAGSYPARRL